MLELQPAEKADPMRPVIPIEPHGDGARQVDSGGGFLSPLVLGGVVAAVVGGVCGFNLHPWAGAAAAALVMAVAGFVVGRRLLLARALGPAEIVFDRWPLQGGDRVVARYRQPLRKQLDVRRLTAKVRGVESATYTVGTSSTTVRHTAHEQDLPSVAVDRVVEELKAEWEFVLPHDAPPSFRAARNQVAWTFDVGVEIDGHPDGAASFLLCVTGGFPAPGVRR